MNKLDEVIENVVNEMTPYLDQSQIEHLRDTLFIQFHGLSVTEESTDLVDTRTSPNELKIKMFLASKRAVNRSENTLRQYERAIHRLLDFLQKPVEKITAMDIRYYFGVLREENHLSATTIQDYQRYLNSFFEFLKTEGDITINPISQVGSIKKDKVIKKPFSHEELEKLRTACVNDRNRAIIEVLYSTGVRVSELCGMNVGDINYGTGEIIVLGKGNKERRTYITDSAMFYLKRYLMIRAGEDDFMNQPLFEMSQSPHNRMTISAVEQMLKRLGKASGVSDVHPHRFRRTIATDLLNRGMPLEQVKTFLGHESVDTTMIYCEVSQEAVKTSHRKYA